MLEEKGEGSERKQRDTVWRLSEVTSARCNEDIQTKSSIDVSDIHISKHPQKGTSPTRTGIKIPRWSTACVRGGLPEGQQAERYSLIQTLQPAGKKWGGRNHHTSDRMADVSVLHRSITTIEGMRFFERLASTTPRKAHTFCNATKRNRPRPTQRARWLILHNVVHVHCQSGIAR